MEDKAASVIIWFCLLGVSGAVVLISITVPSVEIGSPVDFQCIKETNSTGSKEVYFRWYLDGKFIHVDNRSHVELSRWTRPIFTEPDLNKTVKCTYGFEVGMINSTSYKNFFCNMTITKLSTSGWFHDVTLLLKIPRKYHWCISDLKPLCTVRGKQIPDITELKCQKKIPQYQQVSQQVSLEDQQSSPQVSQQESLEEQPVSRQVSREEQQVSRQVSREEQQVSRQVSREEQQVLRQVSREEQRVSQQDQLPTQPVQHELEEQQEEQQSRTTFTQRRSIFVAIAGNSFLYGYNMAVLNNPSMTIIAYYNKTNGEIPSDIETREYVDNNYSINLQWSFVNAVYVLCGVLGAWSAEKIAAKFGRRKPMMYNTILGIIASAFGAVTIYSNNISILILHRMIIGLYCGIGLILSGMYAMEISKFTLNNVKGSYGTYDRWFQLSITAGICVSSFLGISTFLGHRDRWQWLLILNVVPVLFNLFLYKCPDSPIYILLQDDPKKIDKARKALKLLCPPNEVVKELDRLKDEVLTEDVLTLKKIRKLFSKPEFRVGLFLVCFLQIAQQLSGINIVIAYSSFIYQGSGVEIELIEWMNSGNVCPYFAIVPVFAYIVLFSLGLGPIPYIIVQELFEQDAQGAAFNVSVALHWLCNFLVMFCFRSLQMSMESYVYLMFSGIVLVLCGIMYKILPETKNKTMTEIKNSKEYKFALTWLCLQTSGTIQSGNSAAEDDRLL
ncbi:GLUT1 [Mytilus edulis]|uniref:SLC2A1 n=1 Tax=Mytilus edulis TaxID=6550 RepID=A0A8S3RLY6_MYTED|nr:GLUT1 [Mytilus edulis]